MLELEVHILQQLLKFGTSIKFEDFNHQSSPLFINLPRWLEVGLVDWACAYVVCISRLCDYFQSHARS